MKSQNPSTSLGEGRGNCPLPSRTHPQKQNLVVYTEELTHLWPLLNNSTRIRYDFYLDTHLIGDLIVCVFNFFDETA